MNVRVVRFTDVDPDHVEKRLAEMDESGGPPEGTNPTRLQILLDAEQRTAVVLQYFANQQDMADAEQAFDSMEASDTPGTRVSVDRCELKLEFGS